MPLLFLADGHCQAVRTCWAPMAEVVRVAPAPIAGVELKMDALAGEPIKPRLYEVAELAETGRPKVKVTRDRPGCAAGR